MSVGGIFQHINNQGIQDKLIMATDQLMNRIHEIGCKSLCNLRKEYPDKSDAELLSMNNNWMPTLNAIEKTHIVFISGSFKPFVALAHEYTKVLPTGQTSLGSRCIFTLPILGEFVNDCVVHIKLSGLSAVSSLDKVRYAEYLGHRLMKKTSFFIQNHELDYYTADNYSAYYEYKVLPHKDTGYLRNIGQEVPKQGFLTADPTVDEVREYRYFGDGPQTFKQSHSDVEMWIPILFWFKDLQCSLPNFMLPKNQTDIRIEFESESNLVAFADYGGGGAYNAPKISDCFLYVNNIFLLPEVHKIFVSRFGFQLIRVHRTHDALLTDSEQSVLLQKLKWPIESVYIGFRPKANTTNSQKWYRNSFVVEKSVKEAVVTGVSTIQVNNAVYYEERHPIDKLELRAHDIVIYPSLPPSFYQSYIPYRYGNNLNTPKHLGWYMINFNFNPGEYQPSGHFNVSRGRELYLHYLSAVNPDNNNYYITPSTPYDLMVIADCINFFYTDKGSAVLRFST